MALKVVLENLSEEVTSRGSLNEKGSETNRITALQGAHTLIPRPVNMVYVMWQKSLCKYVS